MNKKRRAPISLVVIAVLFILIGAFAAADIVGSWARGAANLNLNVVGLLIGPGLLRLRSGCRELALVYLWLSMIAVVVVAIVILASAGPLDFSFLGETIAHASKTWMIAFAAAYCLLAAWPLRVLTRPDVRNLFRDEPA